ncbi:NAD-dependent epimerase/dehydratase family protein [Streptomyces tsukubensis]|uniref:Reductase n=1 Tax=Streptomyces tsukubensis TaxID=83656 RepID=A0A1V3ZZJ0_9ACTN|nr:NAD-dependent epimerase/dehydratase family protein [Streptomyces tsukubensis]OON71580.1 reductase [Streptomyces tsukubensis]QFR93243.1 NAD-dependent epimerase/dehydratase family protein [Streptomyces tsukubensis]
MTKRLLILGGTEFLGRATAEAALAGGWEVTVFHRGTHAPPAGARELRGDRTEPDGLAALAQTTERWDAVVDTWSAAPGAVRDSARLLADRAERYVYVSTCSVYAWPRPAGTGTEAPLVEGDPDSTASTDYPGDKRGAELAAVREFGADRTVLARAGLILGPYENIGRLPWWLTRIERGGTVAAPGPRGLPLQYIDARDLARWLLDAADQALSGPYDLVSPGGHTTMEELLEACVRVTGSTASLRWVSPEAVEAAGVEPWTELPVWCPPGELHDAMHRADVTRTLESGLRCRPVGETVADTWAWLVSIGGVPPRREGRPSPGLTPEREADLLKS